MIALGVFFFLLSCLAFLPVVLITLGKYNGTTIERIEQFITAHDAIILSIGTVILVTTIGLFAGHLANRSAEKRDRSNQKVLSELKIAEFRQMWINDMRNDLTEFGHLAFEFSEPLNNIRMVSLRAKVMMRLNMTEALSQNLQKSMNLEFAGREEDMENVIDEYLHFVECSSYLLKAEWRRLKSDIREAQLLGEQDQI